MRAASSPIAKSDSLPLSLRTSPKRCRRSSTMLDLLGFAICCRFYITTGLQSLCNEVRTPANKVRVWLVFDVGFLCDGNINSPLRQKRAQPRMAVSRKTEMPGFPAKATGTRKTRKSGATKSKEEKAQLRRSPYFCRVGQRTGRSENL